MPVQKSRRLTPHVSNLISELPRAAAARKKTDLTRLIQAQRRRTAHGLMTIDVADMIRGGLHSLASSEGLEGDRGFGEDRKHKRSFLPRGICARHNGITFGIRFKHHFASYFPGVYIICVPNRFVHVDNWSGSTPLCFDDPHTDIEVAGVIAWLVVVKAGTFSRRKLHALQDDLLAFRDVQ